MKGKQEQNEAFFIKKKKKNLIKVLGVSVLHLMPFCRRESTLNPSNLNGTKSWTLKLYKSGLFGLFS